MLCPLKLICTAHPTLDAPGIHYTAALRRAAVILWLPMYAGVVIITYAPQVKLSVRG
jgi:hypothetical protein